MFDRRAWNDKRLGLMATLLASGAFAWVLAADVVRFVSNPEAGSDPAAAGRGVKKRSSESPAHRLKEITNAHLFGQANTKAGPEITQAPQTRLKLKLLGVVASQDKNFARAIIASGNESAEGYAIGEVIKRTQAKVHRIEAQRVLLDRNGKMESLPLVKPALKSSQRSPVAASPRSNSKSRSRSRSSSKPWKRATKGKKAPLSSGGRL